MYPSRRPVQPQQLLEMNAIAEMAIADLVRGRVVHGLSLSKQGCRLPTILQGESTHKSITGLAQGRESVSRGCSLK